MAVKYTTATIVRSYLKDSGTQLSDAEIEEIISQCEAWLDMIIKMPSTGFTFNSASHGHSILRHIVSLKTALLVLASTPLSHQTLRQAGMTADILYDQYVDALKFIADGPALVQDLIQGDL